MIAPEVRRRGNGETSRAVLLRNNLLVSALIFAALQFWRPCFFSTDDNLDGNLPFFHEMGTRLLAGQSPFHTAHLFGGHYDLLRDPSFFMWHPVYFAISLLAGTPLHWLIVDADAFVLLMLATAGFVNLAWYLRRDLALQLSDRWVMFYALSFTYSMIALGTGASWLNFLGNYSALPWLALGIMHRDAWRGAALVALFNLHQTLAGHLEPTISSDLFFSIFALALSLIRRSVVPLRSWVAGSAVALFFILPLLLPVISGFLLTARSHGVDVTDMTDNSIPLSHFSTSLFLGMAFWLVHPADVTLSTTYLTALGSCAAAWCFVPALLVRPWTRLEWLVVAMLCLISVFIVRPVWVSEIMIHLPLLKSMRWPFREFLQFQFFFHLFLLLRPPGLTQRLRGLLALLSVGLFVPPLLLHDAPTFANMQEDRQLLYSGAFDSYWNKVRPLLHPDERIAVILPPKLYKDKSWQKPYCLLGTYNYACLARVVNVWGWSQTPPRDQFDVRELPRYVFGSYTPEQRPLLAREDPAIRFMTLESLQPIRITLSSREGPPIDLTPFIPEKYRANVGPER